MSIGNIFHADPVLPNPRIIAMSSKSYTPHTLFTVANLKETPHDLIKSNSQTHNELKESNTGNLHGVSSSEQLGFNLTSFNLLFSGSVTFITSGIGCLNSSL